MQMNKFWASAIHDPDTIAAVFGDVLTGEFREIDVEVRRTFIRLKAAGRRLSKVHIGLHNTIICLVFVCIQLTILVQHLDVIEAPFRSI